MAKRINLASIKQSCTNNNGCNTLNNVTIYTHIYLKLCKYTSVVKLTRFAFNSAISKFVIVYSVNWDMSISFEIYMLICYQYDVQWSITFFNWYRILMQDCTTFHYLLVKFALLLTYPEIISKWKAMYLRFCEKSELYV